MPSLPGARHSRFITHKEPPLTPDLVALALASLPLLAFVALVIETIRGGSGAADLPPANLLQRACGA